MRKSARNPACQDFLDSAGVTGLPINDDFNDGEQEDLAGIRSRARRPPVSTVVAYLHPIMDRPNVSVET